MLRALHALWWRVRALFAGVRDDAALRDDLAFWLECEAEANRARGMAPDEALRAARMKLGSMERFTEEVRDARGARGVLDFGRDVRLALRALVRTPAFTLVLLVTLALGIGATSAVFGLMNRLLLRPVPGVVRPEQLVTVRFQRDELNYTGISLVNFRDLQPAVTAFTHFAGYSSISLQVAVPGSEPVNMTGAAVVGDYFGALGVRAARGRLFTPAELEGTADPLVLVLSAEAAATLFAGADPIGRTARVNGHVLTVVGVVPSEFRGTETVNDYAAWLPPVAYIRLRHLSLDPDNRRAGTFRELFGRLAPGATAEQAEQQLRGAMQRLIAEHPTDNVVYERNVPTVHAVFGMAVPEREHIGGLLRLLFGVSLLVLLIACANVANLLVFRGVVRRGESAVRRALGASGWRLLQQHVAEGLLIAVFATAGALLVALLLVRLLIAGLVVGGEVDDLAPDWRVLAFTSTIALLVSLAFAAVPLVLTRRLDLAASLRHSHRSETARLGRTRSALVVFQLGASVALLIVSLLLGRTVRALGDVELGYDPDRIMAFSINDESQGYTPLRRALLKKRLLEGARLIPGVEAAAVTAASPFARARHGGVLRLPGAADGDVLETDAQWITEDYFRVLDVPVLAGRTFTAAEAADSARLVVLSRAAALHLFGTIDVVGRTVQGGFRPDHVQTVIGVVQDVRQSGLRGPSEPAVYMPQGAYPLRWSELLVRTRPGTRVEPPVRRLLASIDPNLPFFRVQLVSDGVRESMAVERFLGRVTTVLALIAGALAAIGLYGLLSYAVAQRTREIGLRVALGARPAAVIRWVTSQMLLLAAAGLLFGMIGGAVLGRLVRAHLFGVSPTDPASNAIAVLLLLVIGLLAAAVPARAATAVDPAEALRAD